MHSSIAGRPSGVPGILMNRLGRAALRVQALGLVDGARGVVGQQRRDLQRHPAVHAVAALVDRREQVGGPPQVAQGEFEEHLLVESRRRAFQAAMSSS